MVIQKQKYISLFLFLFLQLFSLDVSNAQLKSVIYDFDGLDIGQTDLPEGDYHNLDMLESISANPLGQSPMLGDRVLNLKMKWNKGKAGFGKGISKFIELNTGTDYINFYIYCPTSNAADSKIDITITEDDNKDNIYQDASDDRWKRSITVGRSSSWQLISLPLSSFADDNKGGNGILDAGFSAAAGKIFNVEFNFYKNSTSEIESSVYLDMICFSEGILPTGSTILDIPGSNPSARCLLGAFTFNTPATIPSAVEGLFPANPQKKLKYVNWYVDFPAGPTSAINLPGSEVTQLLQNGYTPVITWQPMYASLDQLDPAQPRLKNIMSGQFDSYIDAFGDKLKSYNDTVIVRFMHEFEGDWYPWSLSNNNQDPAVFIQTFRKVVDRIRARGATKVKWMWCINGPEYHPVMAYNWVVSAYPGDPYVDIVACDIYNAGTPYWRSFRTGMAEPYFYLCKYFPNKPLFICESGCAERVIQNNSTSQTKAQWIEQMDKELRSTFKRVKALLFFDVNKDRDYRLNSCTASQNSVETNIWNRDYYFEHPSSLGNVPLVNITSPLNNATHSTPTNITINVDATSKESTITKVEFYQGNTKIGEDQTSPFSYLWMNATTGNYILKAVATDANGQQGTSQLVNITITSCSTPIITASGPTTFCTGTVKLNANTGPGLLYLWQKDGVDISTATNSSYIASASGDYQVKTIQGSCISWSAPTTVKILNTLSASITPGGSTAICPGANVILYANTCSEYSYQWQKDGSIISGATASTYYAGVPGNYQVVVSMGSSKAWSSVISVTAKTCVALPEKQNASILKFDSAQSKDPFMIKVFPNPNNGIFTIQLNMITDNYETVHARVMNMMGQLVYTKDYSGKNGFIQEAVELDSSSSPGIYMLQIIIGDKMETTNVILAK